MNFSRSVTYVGFVSAVCIITSMGCSSFVRNSKEQPEVPAKVELPETVGAATRQQGLGIAAVESVALVTGLAGTGSDPPPSQQRQTLLEEMKKRKVDSPNSVLADPNTALVLVRAILPPGVRKGDPLDIEVRVPSRSKTTALAGGWLLETKLREVAILEQEVHSGHVRAVAEGPVLVDAMLQDEGDEVSHVRGRILGGGVATKSRPIGLFLKSEHHSFTLSKLVGLAINQRFDTYLHGKRQGAATPKTDKFIELTIHPRYRDNLIRYLRVIEQIQLRETPEQRLARLNTLEGELVVPATSSLAALKLEAIGEEAIASLAKGLESPSSEVRFYASEALAYLDHATAARPLAESTSEPAFRSRALLALGAMSSVESHDELTKLLHVSSAETRYGAFRAMQNMNPRDPLLGQETLGRGIRLHHVASHGEPMIHVARTRRPEIVLFGSDQVLESPLMVLVDKNVDREERNRIASARDALPTGQRR